MVEVFDLLVAVLDPDVARRFLVEWDIAASSASDRGNGTCVSSIVPEVAHLRV